MRRLWLLGRTLTRTNRLGADLATGLCFAMLAYLFTGFFAQLSYQRYYWFLLALGGAAVHVLSRTGFSVEEPDARVAHRSG
jgi:hypothetical protein